MTTKIRKVTDFPQAVLNDQLAQQATMDAQAEHGVDDSISTELAHKIDFAGQGPAAALPLISPNPVGLSLGAVLEEVKQDASVLSTDPVALENTSTAPCKEAAVIFTDSQKAQFQQNAMKAAALSSPRALHISETPTERRKQLAEDLKRAMLDQPIPDVTTYAEGRKISMPSEVTAQANTVGKAKAMAILEKIIGKETTAKVVLCARQAGVCFFQKPHLWLGQRMFFEMSKRGMWDRIQPDPAYASPLDETQKEVVAKGLAVIFSWPVADQLAVIARVRGIELDHAAKLMIEQVCNSAIEEKKPKDYSEVYDDTQSLEQLIGAA
jgi:hypothetical protein